MCRRFFRARRVVVVVVRRVGEQIGLRMTSARPGCTAGAPAIQGDTFFRRGAEKKVLGGPSRLAFSEVAADALAVGLLHGWGPAFRNTLSVGAPKNEIRCGPSLTGLMGG